MSKVSVIIITRNRANTLAHCLLSLLSQSALPDEIVIIDNGSVDSTKTVVSNLKTRFSLKIRRVVEAKVGRWQARNRGIREAKYDWIAFLDDDCVVDTEWLKTVKQEIAKNKNIQAVLPHTETFYPDNIFAMSANLIDQFWKSNRTQSEKVLDTEILDTKNVFFQKKFIKKQTLSFRKVYPESEIDASEDCDFGMQFGQAGGHAVYKRNSVAFHKDQRSAKEYWHKFFLYGLSHVQYERAWQHVRKREQRYYSRFLPFATQYCRQQQLGQFLTLAVISNSVLTIALRKAVQFLYAQ